MYPGNMSEFDYDQHSLYTYDHIVVKQEPMGDSCSEMSEPPIYTDLSSVQYTDPRLTQLKQEKSGFSQEFDNLLSWTAKHPEHWSNREVLDWVYYVAEMKQFDCSQFYGEHYQSFTGEKLCKMNLDDFIELDAHYGPVLYELLTSLVQKSKFCEPLPPDSLNPDAYPFLETTYPCLPVPISSMSDASSIASDDLSVFVNDCGVTTVDIDGVKYDIDVQTKIDLDLGYVSAGSDMENNNHVARCCSTSSDPYDVFSISDEEDMQTQTSNFSHFPQTTKKCAFPSASSDEGMDDKTTPQRKRINSNSKGNHLWEFIRDLLKDSSLNPSLLKWEDKEAGVFKFVQSEAVANMWGRKKNNPGMTYEKLSRAMRFCRSAGYFGDVPKNGKFPKKLCFRFGPKAHDWK